MCVKWRDTKSQLITKFLINGIVEAILPQAQVRYKPHPNESPNFVFDTSFCLLILHNTGLK